MSPHDLVLTPTGLRFWGRKLPYTIGRGGISCTKHEGDGATPVGRHRIVTCLYRPDRLAPPNSWAAPIRPGDLWSDDPKDIAYNHLVRAPHPFSHEELRRSDPLYDLILLTDWNWPEATPGRGSAIFIHQWRRPGYPTEGCIAVRRDHLHWLTSHLQIGTNLIVRDQNFEKF